jgi:nickel-dependent lactate racemase
VQATAARGQGLGAAELAEVLFAALEDKVAGERVLVLVPDRTRNVPLAEVFPIVAQALHRAGAVDVMVALGTHAPLPEQDILDMIGGEGGPRSPVTSVGNHQWSTSSALSRIGTVAADRLREIAGATWHRSLGGDLPVRVNKRALEVDRVVIVGPTLPHEVAGFSGGAKYLFPGISGPEMIDVMHWLGALSGVLATIGYPDTAVRALIGEAASLLPTPVSLVALVTDTSAGTDLLAGVYAGDMGPAWSASVAQAGQLHTHWLDRPYSRVISCPMPIYGELWTAAKAMYKLEAAVADGGELIIYAPGLSEVSVAHGTGIFKVGYHCLAYFLGQWDRFSQDHLAVLAHSTHVKGAGTFDEATGTERPRIDVKLATAISAQDCERLNLGYVDAVSLDLADAGTDGETLVVPRSGEMLFRVRE